MDAYNSLAVIIFNMINHGILYFKDDNVKNLYITKWKEYGEFVIKNKDKIDGLILQFCLACLVLSDDDIKPNFLIELKDYIDSIDGKINISGGYYLKYLSV